MAINDEDKIVNPPKEFKNSHLLARGLKECRDLVFFGSGYHDLSKTWPPNVIFNIFMSVLTHDVKRNSTNKRCDVNNKLFAFLMKYWDPWTWNPDVGTFVRFNDKARWKKKITNALGRKAPARGVTEPENTLSTFRHVQLFSFMVIHSPRDVNAM